MGVRCEFDAELWETREDGGWTFLSLPEDESEEIRAITGGRSGGGFGAVPVSVRIGGSSWRTSVFPSAAKGVYVLPVKKQVRTAERVVAGDVVRVAVQLRDS